MFIDIHQHHSPKPGAPLTPELQKKWGFHYTSPEETIKHYDGVGVEKAVILPIGSPEAMRIGDPLNSEGALKLAYEYPDRFIPFCNLDPRRMFNTPTAPLGKYLECMKDRGAKGVGEMVANLPFLDPRMANLFHFCEEFEMPVLFHIAPILGGTYGVYDDPGLPQLEMSLMRFPKMIFIGHAQAFWSEIGTLETPMGRGGYQRNPVKEEGVLPKLLRKYPNLVCDLSANSGYWAMARDRAFAMHFLEEFSDRVMFGSDMSLAKPTPLMELLLDARGKDLSEETFQKVCRLNAIRILKL